MTEPGNAAPPAPRPEEIDALATRYQQARDELAATRTAFDSIEQEAIEMVTTFGVVPPHAEKSRRLKGRLADLTVTKADVITIDDARVRDLRDSLQANGNAPFFARLFAERTKYEVVDGAEAALKVEALPKRLAERVLNMFGRCFTVKPKKPSLKVVIADPAKPAKKQRGAKGARP